jgi:hypothetical protein
MEVVDRVIWSGILGCVFLVCLLGIEGRRLGSWV